MDFGVITDIEIGPDGFVHVLSITGDIYRIVPEPGTAGSVGLGLAAFAALGRRRARAYEPAIARMESRPGSCID